MTICPQNFRGSEGPFLERKFRLRRLRSAAARKRGGYSRKTKTTGVTKIYQLLFNTVTVVLLPAFSISADILSIPRALLFFSLLTARRTSSRSRSLVLALLVVQCFQLLYSPAHESLTVFWSIIVCHIRTGAPWFCVYHRSSFHHRSWYQYATVISSFVMTKVMITRT